jgi:hypothetical protein
MLVMLATLLIGGCKSTVTGPESELAVGRARWAMVGPASYSVVVGRACECLDAAAGPVFISVRNGVVQSRQYTRTGAAVTSMRDDWFPTVEGLFAVIDAAIRDGIMPLDVSYDPTLGYPTRVFIGETATDGGEAYYARDVKVQ